MRDRSRVHTRRDRTVEMEAVTDQLSLLAKRTSRSRKPTPLTKRITKTALIDPPKDQQASLRFHIPGDPVPCQRPRVGRYGNVYTPGETVKYERHVASHARVAAYNARWTKMMWACRVILIVTRSKASGDLDNLTKGVLDGITKSGAVWIDDRCVHELHAKFDPTAPQPGVLVIVSWDGRSEQEKFWEEVLG